MCAFTVVSVAFKNRAAEWIALKMLSFAVKKKTKNTDSAVSSSLSFHYLQRSLFAVSHCLPLLVERLYPFALYDVGVYYSFIGLQIFLTLTCLPELLKS